MTTPTLLVELGLPTTGGFIVGDGLGGGSQLDTGTLLDDGGFAWTDVTPWVEAGGRQLAWSRGASKLQGVSFRYEAGRCSFRLDNRDGRFDPTNLASPYVAAGINPLQPNLPLRVRWQHADAASNPEVAWQGVCDDWKLGFAGDLDAWVDVTGVDGPAVMTANGRAVDPPVGDGDDVATRLHRILDSIGWPTDKRDIDTTVCTRYQATSLADAAWTEMMKVADSDGGFLWVDRKGRVVYRSRVARSLVPQLTFSTTHGATILGATDYRWAWGFDNVRNTFRLTRANGVQQLATSDTSVAKYGDRGYERNDLLNQQDYEVDELAQWLLSQWQDQGLSVSEIDVHPIDADTADVWNSYLRADVGLYVRTISTTVYGRTLTYDAMVTGISWKVDAAHKDWRATLALVPVPAYPTGGFVLSSPADAVLDQSVLT